MLIALRPNTKRSVQPDEIYNVINRKINKDIQLGEEILWQNIK